MLHRAIEELEAAYFERWLELFEQTALRVFAPDIAEIVVDRARQIGTVLGGHLTPPYTG